MEIILATTNFHKIREFRDMFKSLPHLELLSLHQFPNYIPPDETGGSIKENAILKSDHAAKELNRWVLADDTGLFIPVLKGEPGIYSARYAGLEASAHENCNKVLSNMASFTSSEDRTAYIECCLAISNPAGVQKCAAGKCEGYIVQVPRGRNGGGYDPIFVKNDYEKTFAELDENIKNRISHRRKAFERLVGYLENLRD
jgi:XTP/dITP diphosphohydrolase